MDTRPMIHRQYLGCLDPVDADLRGVEDAGGRCTYCSDRGCAGDHDHPHNRSSWLM
jgi:hypothetical protein